MAKNKESQFVQDVLYIVIFLISLVISLIVKLILIIYYYIIYKKNNYKSISDLSFFKVYTDKGNFGEFRLFMKLKKINQIDNILVNTYLVHDGNTDETEIDVLTVNKYGVFVYEMKNYSGYIYGSNNDKTWTQVLGYKKYKFFNPFRQNYAHVKALEKIIPDYINVIRPVVVFSNRSSFKKLKLYETQVLRKLKNVNNIINRKSEIVLKDEQITEIVNAIKKASLSKYDIRDKHINQVKALQNY